MKNIKKIADMIFKSSKDFELEGIEIPFTYKDNAIYVDRTKIADVKKDSIVFVHSDYKDFGGDEIINYFHDKLKSKEVKHEIKTTVDIKHIGTETDSQIDSSGHEHSYVYADRFKVYWLDVDVTHLISQKELKKVNEQIDEKLNEDHEPKSLGTHRTH